VLDLICGRTKLTEGSIKFKDQEITTKKEQEIVRLGIGRKFQTPSIYEDLTVFENLEISYPRGRSVAGESGRSLKSSVPSRQDQRFEPVAADGPKGSDVAEVAPVQREDEQCRHSVAEPLMGRDCTRLETPQEPAADDKVRVTPRDRPEHTREAGGVVGVVPIQEDQDVGAQLRGAVQACEARPAIASALFSHDDGALGAGDVARAVRAPVVDDDDGIDAISWELAEHARYGVGLVERRDDDADILAPLWLVQHAAVHSPPVVDGSPACMLAYCAPERGDATLSWTATLAKPTQSPTDLRCAAAARRVGLPAPHNRMTTPVAAKWR